MQISFTVIDLTIGTMDEPDAIAPEFHYWYSKHLAWVEFAGTLPRQSFHLSGEA